jgi:DNA mismatch repair ATPase MutS
MGGKTVALETLVFMQVLAQAGFFVPAASFDAPVAPLIHYVGELRRTTLKDRPEGEGLSGFGFEIRSFVEAWEESREGAFMVLDEFARTTSSHEAEAILTAVVSALVERKGLRSVFSTHFRGVGRLAGVRYLRVRGLDREAARCTICDDEGEPLRDRIRRINGMMEYGLVDDTGPGPGGSDAVAIASLLGLDRGIVARAEEIYDRHS